MAYNLESLITILNQILNPAQTRWILDHEKPQMESLLHKAASLKQILENSSPAAAPKMETLESQIRDAAHKAEDIIESHMADQILSRPGGRRFTISPPDLQQVVQQLDSAMEQAREIVDGDQISRTTSLPDALSLADLTSSSNVVGLDQDLMELKDRLTGQESKLEIIPIVGMGGIGKTTLAQNLYRDPLVASHFDTRAWITISQDYDMEAILLGLLGCINNGKLPDKQVRNKISELKDSLYKSLYGRRYLIVLDDMWSTRAWNDIRRCFPSSNDGSRIILTTRESDVAKYAGSQSKQHQMQLLSKSESWDLLQKEVFGEENCPAALEKIGRNIASNCGGLPLAIHVIGGLLLNAKRSRDVWGDIAKDVRVAIAEKDEHFSNILSLSYNHLPNHLRPCFLYMGAFPEDYDIKASRLIHLWVAEGFLKSNGDKSFEEEAEDCLKALVDRNLVSIRGLKSNQKPKSYGIHDLLRDLCLKKAQQQRLVHVKNKQVGNLEKDSIYSIRRVSVHPSYRIRDIYASTEFMSSARSFLCNCRASHEILSSVFFALRLLRVLDILDIEFQGFPTEILHIVNLRHLAFSCNSYELPSELSRLWNLQTLIVCSGSSSNYIILPSEIWEVLELRHIKIKKGYIYMESGFWKGFIQEKLQTIATVCVDAGDGFLSRIPNIKKLGLSGNWMSFRMYDLSHLHKLETLNFCGISVVALVSPSTLRLPPSLRKLTLTRCKVVEAFMEPLCALPNLEVLKIRECEVESRDPREWDATQQVFSTLQFLLLERLEMVHWQADETNFPRLRRLVIRGCSALEEIPCGIGEIPTLQTIELAECRPSLVASAQLIMEEQRELGNYDLQLHTSAC